MTHQNRYMVIYKDGPDYRSRYFGPFVSITLAESFLTILPDPQPGGNKVWKPVEPYTASDAVFARDAILRARGNRDLADVLTEIARTH